MRTLINECKVGKHVKIQGWVYKIRRMKTFAFIVVQDRTGYIQVVTENSELIDGLTTMSTLTLEGEVVEGKNDYGNVEVHASSVNIINRAVEELPITMNGKELELSLDTRLTNRVVSLHRHEEKAIFKVQAQIVQSFVRYLSQEGFTQIHTPKLVSEGAEGGSEVFTLDYFGRKAYLAQSPQFYKQMMVASSLERVFEVGHVYRAEEHSSRRHLNEYVSLDIEMGFIESEEDIMKLEENLLRSIFADLEEQCKKSLNIMGVTIPKLSEPFPRMTVKEAIEILKIEYNMNHLENDLDPQGEKAIGEYAREKFASDFIFLTDYPRKKRPMYTMPLGEEGTRSFDLLYKGLEITTGGQRIHDYEMLCKSMRAKGLNPENYESYVNTFKYGVPPHGGLAIGLERLTAQILNIDNVRLTTLFPRDKQRLTP